MTQKKKMEIRKNMQNYELKCHSAVNLNQSKRQKATDEGSWHNYDMCENNTAERKARNIYPNELHICQGNTHSKPDNTRET